MLKKIEKLTGTTESLSTLLRFASESIIATAKQKAPSNFGELIQSDFITRQSVTKKGGSYKIGFNKAYAAYMDRGFRTRIMRPIHAKALYIPITRRGMRTGPLRGSLRGLGQSRSSGGAVKGRDFVLRASAKKPRLKSYGSRRGPNQFFSGTLLRIQSDPRKFLRKLGSAWVRQIRLQQGN